MSPSQAPATPQATTPSETTTSPSTTGPIWHHGDLVPQLSHITAEQDCTPGSCRCTLYGRARSQSTVHHSHEPQAQRPATAEESTTAEGALPTDSSNSQNLDHPLSPASPTLSTRAEPPTPPSRGITILSGPGLRRRNAIRRKSRYSASRTTNGTVARPLRSPSTEFSGWSTSSRSPRSEEGSGSGTDSWGPQSSEVSPRSRWLGPWWPGATLLGDISDLELGEPSVPVPIPGRVQARRRSSENGVLMAPHDSPAQQEEDSAVSPLHGQDDSPNMQSASTATASSTGLPRLRRVPRRRMLRPVAEAQDFGTSIRTPDSGLVVPRQRPHPPRTAVPMPRCNGHCCRSPGSGASHRVSRMRELLDDEEEEGEPPRRNALDLSRSYSPPSPRTTAHPSPYLHHHNIPLPLPSHPPLDIYPVPSHTDSLPSTAATNSDMSPTPSIPSSSSPSLIFPFPSPVESVFETDSDSASNVDSVAERVLRRAWAREFGEDRWRGFGRRVGRVVGGWLGVMRGVFGRGRRREGRV